MSQEQPRTLLLILIAIVLVCGGSLATAVFVYNQLQARTAVTPVPIPLTTAQTVSEQGLLITAIIPNSTGAQAGLRRGDILLQADETTLETTQDLQQVIWAHETGDEIAFMVLRGEETAVIPVALAESLPRLGLELLGSTHPISTTIQSSTGSIKPTISHVVPDTPAAAAGLEPGDIIAVVNDQVILTGDDLLAAMTGKQPGEAITLMLRRGPDTLVRSIILAQHPDDPDRGYLGIELVPAP